MPERAAVVTLAKYAFRIAGLMLLLMPALVVAGQLQPGQLPPPAADGRMLGHLPYGETWRDGLVRVADEFGIGGPCLLQREAARDLARMIAAANAAGGIGYQLRGISCFRSVAHQARVFCGHNGDGNCADAVERARVVGPPGFSEHATGYAIDFVVRPSPGCYDTDACIAQSPPGRWLIANANKFGFEQSFPIGNRQGVTWEPWHWRWVGVTPDAPGAADARRVFVRARSQFAARPAIVDPPVIEERWPVVDLTIPAPYVARKGRKK